MHISFIVWTCYSVRLASSVLLDNYGIKPWNEGKLSLPLVTEARSLDLNGYEVKKNNLKIFASTF